MNRAVHFVGVIHPDQGKDPRYTALARVFGPADFVHRYWDRRAHDEVMPGDVVVCTGGKKADAAKEPEPNAFDDSAIM
jgi:hypothetical protein